MAAEFEDKLLIWIAGTNMCCLEFIQLYELRCRIKDEYFFEDQQLCGGRANRTGQ
jgi:hypothetical protein